MGTGSNAWANTIWLSGLENTTDAARYAYSISGQEASETTQGDNKMSSVAAVAGILGWWQDSVEKSGAIIVPETAPRGEGIWTKLSTEWKNKGAQPGHVLQYYLSGDTGYSNNAGQWLTQEGLEYSASGGFYPHLQGTHLELNDWSRIPFPTDSVVQFVDSRGYNSTLDPKAYSDGYTSYAQASKNLVEFLNQGCGAVLNGNAIMSLYAVETDENGGITKVWYHDSRHYEEGSQPETIQSATVKEAVDPNTGRSYMVMEVPKKPCDITEESPEETTTAILSSFSLIRTKGLQFDTYETVAGADNTADLFSHYLNLKVDGASDYKLKYDLRNAMAGDSPVDSKGQRTGDITLQSGKLSLVDGEKENGGGSTSGTISFGTAGGDGGTRTLTADRSGQIADTIQINASLGNTLEVTGDNVVTFNKLTGEGNLTKIGTGTAKVAQEVTLKGKVIVEAGEFILPEGIAADSETFQLLVFKDGKVVNKAGEAATLSLTSGVHTNDGVLALATSVGKDAVMKGSGTFAEMTVEKGGQLVVGNSPGHQQFTGDLTLDGTALFSADGFAQASSGENTGWGSGAYSTIDMLGNNLIINEEGEIVVALGDSILDNLPDSSGEFSMTLASNIGNAEAFDEEALRRLASQTTFSATDELAARGVIDPAAQIGNVAYAMLGNNLMLTGTLANGSVPEPTTGTLSLLALAGLCARRRKKQGYKRL